MSLLIPDRSDPKYIIKETRDLQIYVSTSVSAPRVYISTVNSDFGFSVKRVLSISQEKSESKLAPSVLFPKFESFQPQEETIFKVESLEFIEFPDSKTILTRDKSLVKSTYSNLACFQRFSEFEVSQK